MISDRGGIWSSNRQKAPTQTATAKRHLPRSALRKVLASSDKLEPHPPAKPSRRAEQMRGARKLHIIRMRLGGARFAARLATIEWRTERANDELGMSQITRRRLDGVRLAARLRANAAHASTSTCRMPISLQPRTRASPSYSQISPRSTSVPSWAWAILSTIATR